jgi:flagellar biosynthetic protein FlhB
MAEQKSDLDKSEPATPFKLERARQRGSIARSGELTFAFVLVVCVACVYGLGAELMDHAALLVGHGLSFAARGELTQAGALGYFGALGTRALVALTPLVFVIWTAALLVAAVQARGVFSAEPVQPDFSRLSPASGLKRLFSRKALHDLWRSAAKLLVIGTAMTVWGRNHLPEILRLPGAPHTMVRGGVALLGSALALLAGVIAAFAIIDWLLSRSEFMRTMRMSKRELKDEHKEREGDPRIKSRLRELRLQWLKRSRQLMKVGNADVLLTNPTHYAVALEYRHGEMPAPMITARGAGDLAERMRAEARRRLVPIVENAPLARALFTLRESQVFVPEEHYEGVARILKWVYAARSRRTAAQVQP